MECFQGFDLLLSMRSKSGYKHVVHDPRPGANRKPWSVHYKKKRSAGFATAREAALHLAKMNVYKADAWMSKPNVSFPVNKCDLFGCRIRVGNRLGVVKSWTPCAAADFGVVLDDRLDHVFMEDLFRKGRSDWTVVDWEDDIWNTQHLRPMCPQCGHPLGTGAAAWTKCLPCGHMEPGVASTDVLARLRSDDPFRRR